MSEKKKGGGHSIITARRRVELISRARERGSILRQLFARGVPKTTLCRGQTEPRTTKEGCARGHDETGHATVVTHTKWGWYRTAQSGKEGYPGHQVS